MPDINLGLLLPEILLVLMAMLLLLLSAWWGKEKRSLIGIIAIATMVLAGLMTLALGGKGSQTTFSGLFILDPFATFTKSLMYLAAIFPLIISLEYLKEKDMDRGEYFVLSLFALTGGLLMASSSSFISLYLGLELMSLSIYVLAAFQRGDPRSNEAGLKYFVLGSLASGIFLYGVTLLYGSLGTVSFEGVQNALKHADHFSNTTIFGALFVLVGFSFKIAAAPFHMWAPDVYEGAPTSVTAFMAVMPKVAAFAALLRVLLQAFAPLSPHWIPVLQVIAVVSLAVGSIAAIAQTNIKRLLAYSSIGHVGYALIGLSAGTPAGFQSVLTYISIYILMNIGAFALILFMNAKGVGEEIQDYQGLSKEKPMLGFLMALMMFSMAGIPPLAGFIGKLYIFKAALEAHLTGLAIAGVLFSAIGAFYYIRVVKVMYFEEPKEAAFEQGINRSNGVVIALVGIAILVLGLFPNPLIDMVGQSLTGLI
ncbi:NADH-quinone oxidoreductase subunit NuoN [Magnetococcales bacterium HHB-1]